MALEPKTISISFGQGVDTKTDPNQVIAGKLLALTNATLGKTNSLQKMNGYAPLVNQFQFSSTALTNYKLATFGNELLSFDGINLNSYNPILNKTQIVDSFVGIEPSVATVVRDQWSVMNPDSAYNANTQSTLYIWAASAILFGTNSVSLNTGNNTNFKVLSSLGSQVFSGSFTNLSRPRAYSLGNNFFVTGVNLASSTLIYYQFNAYPTSSIPTSATIGNINPVFADIPSPHLFPASFPRYDGAIAGNNLLITRYFGLNVFTTKINPLGQITGSTSFVGAADGILGTFANENNYWIIYGDTSTNILNYQVLGSSGLMLQNSGNILTRILPGSAQTGYPMQVTGVVTGSSANIYYSTYNEYPDNPNGNSGWPGGARSDFITYQQIDQVNGPTQVNKVFRGMGVSSKANRINNNDYFISSYGPVSNTNESSSANRYEPTYFLISPTQSNWVISKFAFQNGGGYDFPTSNRNETNPPLPNLSQTSNSTFLSTYLFKSAVVNTQSGPFVPITYGMNSIVFDFNSANSYNTVPLGNNLNIAGGYLSAYDGVNVTEQNFHLFPEDIRATTGGGAGVATNTYSYSVIYEWQDNQGNIHKSNPSVPIQVQFSQTSNNVFLNVPTLRITNKKNAYIRVFRNAPSIDVLTFHDINPNNPTPNNLAVDSVTIQDAYPDNQIIGNPVLYTTGGVLPDSGSPSPHVITRYKDRLFIVDAENRGTYWYSKEVFQGTPVEMSPLQTFLVNRKIGDINAGIEMDDKLITFISNPNSVGIYYITGLGPDATGNNNDFSEPIFITATVSTANPNSVTVMQDGLMFQSSQGIWLLDRSLGTGYIGAGVEFYNNALVTSANPIPNTTEIRFTLNTGVALVWDYFQKQWSTFSNIPAAHSTIFKGLFSYFSLVGRTGNILQETPGAYSNNGSPILMSLQTGWIGLSGLQGYQRVYEMFVMGHYLTPHFLSVSVGYDFNPSPSQTATIVPVQVGNPVYGGSPLWGSGNLYGGSTQFQQNKVNFTRQKCQSIQISIQEVLDPLNIVLGAGVQLENLALVIGTKLSYPKIPAKLSVK